MVQDRTIHPYARDLFHAYDHLLRLAKNPQDLDADWHREWAKYHFKRFRGAHAAYIRENPEQIRAEGVDPDKLDWAEASRTFDNMSKVLGEL